ncbi:hypothetical protein OG884_03025 [Streptosporangium sp. NBC_01755]|uniref:hypothetical protein n=1 Tax=unclassified Streptosporangium TaxID=2632669 RepID=UPI002DD8F5AE|nr:MULTISPECIES: hypothetical protein [unclassified Streptosporangium]WSA27601.1 hypothetical protein OIE13_06935 [Streptosporangium sp. NBC_01810]WSD00928.1 hypothetical protein OG884_03025 [Streptosporangium sp. NBC_01755]
MEREEDHHAYFAVEYAGGYRFDPALDVIVDTQGRDPGVYLRAHQILSAYEGRYAHAVVMLDAAW